MADPPVDKTPSLLSRETFDRLDDALSFVDDEIRTRDPRDSIQRSPGAAAGAWGLLAAGDVITPASGLTLGGGTVKLCDQDGDLIDPTADEVTVYNPGPHIGPVGGDLVIPLGWIGENWAVLSTCCEGTGDCRLMCIVLDDVCGTTVPPEGGDQTPWNVKVTDPHGATVFDGIDPPCLDISARDPGVYHVVVSKDIDLSMYSGGTPSHHMEFTADITVEDPCHPPERTVIQICEDWYVMDTVLGCDTSITPDPESPCYEVANVTVVTNLGTYTGPAGAAFVFFDFDCMDTPTVTWEYTPGAPWEGSCSGEFPRCPDTVNPNFPPESLGGQDGCFTIPDDMVCACCDQPMPRTLAYSDSTGVSCDLVWDDGFSAWRAVGVSGLSDDSYHYDAENNCCFRLPPGSAYLCDIIATCECGDEEGNPGVRFNVVKNWYVCSYFGSTGCDPPDDDPNCGTHDAGGPIEGFQTGGPSTLTPCGPALSVTGSVTAPAYGCWPDIATYDFVITS